MRPTWALLALIACSSSSSTPDGSVGTPDGSVGTPDGSVGAPDGSVDARTTAKADAPAGLACAATVDAYCSQFPSCLRNWSQTPKCGAHLFTQTCGTFDVFGEFGVDTGNSSYYDHASGSLVAIVSTTIIGTRCTAGPASFALPDGCTEPALLPACGDAAP